MPSSAAQAPQRSSCSPSPPAPAESKDHHRHPFSLATGCLKKVPDGIWICCNTPRSSQLALLEQSKTVNLKGLLLYSKSARGEVIGVLEHMKILSGTFFGTPCRLMSLAYILMIPTMVLDVNIVVTSDIS